MKQLLFLLGMIVAISSQTLASSPPGEPPKIKLEIPTITEHEFVVEKIATIEPEAILYEQRYSVSETDANVLPVIDVHKTPYEVCWYEAAVFRSKSYTNKLPSGYTRDIYHPPLLSDKATSILKDKIKPVVANRILPDIRRLSV